MAKYDYIVVGSGLFGAVFAREATDRGKRVLVLEKRDHIAGNTYTEMNNGIQVHKYGAHIFHTNDKEVWDYVNRFADFNRYTNSPLANYKGELYSLPFNMYTFHEMWGVIDPSEAKRIIDSQKKKINREANNLEEQALSLVGTDIYEKLIKGYTEKQWGKKCEELPASIIRRLPVRFVFDNNYFDALYQGIPTEGYTEMVSKILNGIQVSLDTNYLVEKEYYDSLTERVVYTGPIDAYFNYSLGHLEYRSLRFETESLNVSNFQGNAVINYTDAQTPYTRIIEHKWFQFGKDPEGNTLKNTIISKEYPAPFLEDCEPYYPINDKRNNELYKEYKDLANRQTKVIFGGRLGEYKYYDMDQVIGSCLALCKKELQ